MVADPAASPPIAEAVEMVKDDVKAQARVVSRAELEGLLAHAIGLFLRDGLDVRFDGRGLPDVEVRLAGDTLVVNVKNLDAAVAWSLASGPGDVAPPEASPTQVLDRFRVFLLLEDDPVVAFGRGIPGVQVKTGKASMILLKDLVKGVLADKTPAREAKRADARREVVADALAHDGAMGNEDERAVVPT